jgi:hypothetical protein
MMCFKNKLSFLLLVLVIFFIPISCKTSQTKLSTIQPGIQQRQLGGGSSGMEKLGDNSYLVVYDLKNAQAGTRLAMITITSEQMQISPISISDWGEEGISNDLESICKIPGTIDEYFIAESGNWKGALGRIFHIRVDTTTFSAIVLGVTKLPYQHINTLELVGDQYESMACLPYHSSERLLLLAERGGSAVNPRGIVRWGIYNLSTHQLKFSDSGMQGMIVNAPGNWMDEKNKRDMTDLHIDAQGGIWASASEDTSDMGPFYSVIYKLGQMDPENKERPFTINNNISKWVSVSGFKIEALSGPSQNINCTHAFGTEDEMYGGVWRAISIK